MSTDVNKAYSIRFTTRGMTFLLFVVAACLGNVAFVDTENLISNPSFEAGKGPSSRGWIVDSTWVDFAGDVPPQGGQWSIKLEAGWAPQEGFAETYYSGDAGKGIYRLTAWMKTLHQWTGTISLGLKKSGQTSIRKSISRDSPQWTQILLQDTLAVSRADSIVVRLSAGMTAVRRGEALFDLVKLEKIPNR